MKPQGQYDSLIEEYRRKKLLHEARQEIIFENMMQKQADADAALNMKYVPIYNIDERYHTPINASIVRIYYLFENRNAWYSTKIERYYTDVIDCRLDKLQNKAEEFRTQGSQFKIESREAIWFNFKNANLLLSEISSQHKRIYDNILECSFKNGLEEFWNNPLIHLRGWLILFEFKNWRPDLISQNEAVALDSLPSGHGKPLRWSCNPNIANEKFINFANNIILRCFGDANED
ncbi:MAG: hypothetical protein LAT81_06085 [Oceanicaulis sp.]|nr:hypothetical protein [Oceanicaulis sp.]